MSSPSNAVARVEESSATNGGIHSRPDTAASNKTGEKGSNDGQQRSVVLTPMFLLLSVVLPILCSFVAGRMVRIYVLQQGAGETPLEPTDPTRTAVEPDSDDSNASCQEHFVEMSNLQRDFLESEHLLSDTMLETLGNASLPHLKLRYYCHKQRGGGVTCVAPILSNGGGHVSLHTWPKQGVASLKAMVCENNNPMVLPESLIRNFGQHAISEQKPQVSWKMETRGSKEDSPDWVLDVDAQDSRIVAHVETRFQQITILSKTNLQFPDLYTPNKLVYLNGHLQSTQYGDASYHEALVQPAMFAHSNPHRVGIIGGGEGATLREVLKHNTIQEVVMVEIDDEMMQISKQFLPEWNTCDSDQESKSCFDEARATIYAQDALAWFMDRFGDTETPNPRGLENAERFDIIIMDALDPQDDSEFCDVLYSNSNFYETLFNALTNKGMLVMQLGEAPKSRDAPDLYTIHAKRAQITDELEKVGFESLHVYSEDSYGFGASWTYLVAFKDYATRVNWYANEAEVELAIRERTIPTAAGQSPLVYFDGATMVSYQTPHKVYESVFCRLEPQPKSCQEYRGFDPYTPHVANRELEVKMSTVGDHAGRGLFATRDIAKGSYIALDTGVDNVFFPPRTFDLVEQFSRYKESEIVYLYMDGYGYEGDSFGRTDATVDSSTNTFVNHGCNGTDNIGFPSWGKAGLTENNVRLDKIAHEAFESVEDHSLYNPALDRNFLRLGSASDVALRDIQAGEELLVNYVMMHAEPEGWKEWILSLRAECSGETVGSVSLYENDRQEQETTQ